MNSAKNHRFYAKFESLITKKESTYSKSRHKRSQQKKMGLDITHYKATLQRPKLIDPFNRHFITVKDFEGFDTSIEYFDKNIQLVDDPIILKTLIFQKKRKRNSGSKGILE